MIFGMFCKIYLFSFIVAFSVDKGNCVILDILPGLIVSPEATHLTVKCSAATDLGITTLDNISIRKGVEQMASIVLGGSATAGTGFDTSKYTISGQLPGPSYSPTDFLQVEISDPDCTDGADYTCVIKAAHGVGPISPDPQLTQSVTVQTGSSELNMVANPDKIVFFENDVVLLTCGGKVGNPAQTWNWERQLSGSSTWEPYPDAGSITTGSLNPPNPDGPTESSLSPPTLDAVNEGDDMTPVSCTHDACNPYCERDWYKEFKDLVTTTNGVLDLKNMKRVQAGTYICHVENPGILNSELIKELVLAVHYGPELLQLNPNSVAPQQEGSSVPPITCSVDCGPVCTIAWYHKSIEPGNVVPTSNGVLKLQSITRYDAGLYICQVIHPVSASNSQSVEIDIEVNCLPSEVTISLSPVKEEYDVEEEVTITCSGGVDHSIKFQQSLSDSSDWVDYDGVTDSQPPGDGCSDKQSTALTVTIGSSSNGLSFRCIQNNNLSESITLKVKQNNHNGGCSINSFGGLVLTAMVTVVVI
ncbi:hypothetical protein LOTGIDRAFT_158061 [Lottia gigantea]|uniref:Ig-like domain-containing protein n=1 Tax=Lottia gigantea TaxID=225164 RepID=V4A7I7_LOTGI|nr:hypothetical protein LOTGIDRAFT_158061 [Lottia gigantea]ESO99903.1 hypothetical protein LOTGIDRAFT_158061 [Lottia gigantea]